MIGPLAYVGGKRRLAAALMLLFPDHRTYVEPFAGGAQVLFAKPPSPVEILNDLSGDVINFFRVCQYHPRELVRWLQHAPASRALWGLCQRQDPDTLTDVQRAARFLYLQKNSYGGLIVKQAYHYCIAKPSNYNPESLPTLIEAVSRRLARVQLECWPYEKILERYDRPRTFFYLDPPYVGVKIYKFNFADEDYGRLADRLRALKGKFLLSINDHPVAREAFRDFEMRPLEVHYTVAAKVPRIRELVFANYPLPASPSLAPEARHVA
jgi:DNA adenine methylase